MRHAGIIKGNLVVQPGDDCTELVGVKGDMKISAHCDAPKLETIVGGVRVHSGARLDASALTSIGSQLDLGADSELSAGRLGYVGGAVTASPGSTIDAPSLAVLAGDLSLCSADVRMPILSSVGGDLQFEDQGSTGFPALRSVDGSISIVVRSRMIDAKPVISVPRLHTVGGTIGLGDGTDLHAPSLARVDGSIDMGDDVTFQAPSLLSVRGNLNVCSGVQLTAPSLLVVSGSIRIYSGSDLLLPSLISVHGECKVDEGGSLRAPVTETAETTARDRSHVRSGAKGPLSCEQAGDSSDRVMKYAHKNGLITTGPRFNR